MTCSGKYSVVTFISLINVHIAFDSVKIDGFNRKVHRCNPTRIQSCNLLVYQLCTHVCQCLLISHDKCRAQRPSRSKNDSSLHCNSLSFSFASSLISSNKARKLFASTFRLQNIVITAMQAMEKIILENDIERKHQ